MSEAYRRQRIREALTRAGHLVLGQPAGPFGGGGRSDLIVCVRPFGIFGAVEVKDIGEKPTRAQRAFGASVERAGGFWIWGSDPREILRHVDLEVAEILSRRQKSITQPGERMSLDIDDLFTNPPPPLKPEELDAFIDESEPTSVPIDTDVTVREVVINGTVVDPGLPEAAAKVMGYESAAAREQIDPPRKRTSRKVKRPEAESPREEKIAELDARDAKLDGESTPFDEVKINKIDYERELQRLADAVEAISTALERLASLRTTVV